jgi:hypothetical protein
MNKFSKIAVYKMSIKRVFLYAIMIFETEIRKTISFTVAIKYEGIHDTNKNCKTLLKIIESKTNKI